MGRGREGEALVSLKAIINLGKTVREGQKGRFSYSAIEYDLSPKRAHMRQKCF